MDYFGASLAGIGDVDGDGMEDMVVGALGDDEAALNAGACGMGLDWPKINKTINSLIH
jgi:hypothetical protein